MTEDKIKEMLKDIIDNGAEYEYRIKAPLHHYDKYYFTNWKPYKLGDEIHDDYEYRKKEKWCVTTQKEIIELNLLKSYETPIFVGNKEECEKWIEKHIKKTWLDETFPLGEWIDDMHIEGEKERWGIYNVCKKILEEVDKTTKERHIRNESFPLNFQKRDIEQIIFHLGVEVEKDIF